MPWSLSESTIKSLTSWIKIKGTSLLNTFKPPTKSSSPVSTGTNGVPKPTLIPSWAGAVEAAATICTTNSNSSSKTLKKLTKSARKSPPNNSSQSTKRKAT
jgi:hypothetical protein